jgi:hypothetical protein
MQNYECIHFCCQLILGSPKQRRYSHDSTDHAKPSEEAAQVKVIGGAHQPHKNIEKITQPGLEPCGGFVRGRLAHKLLTCLPCLEYSVSM